MKAIKRGFPWTPSIPSPVLTTEDVHANGGCVGRGRRARVEARVGLDGLLHEQATGGEEPLLGDQGDAASRRVKVNYL